MEENGAGTMWGGSCRISLGGCRTGIMGIGRGHCKIPQNNVLLKINLPGGGVPRQLSGGDRVTCVQARCGGLDLQDFFGGGATQESWEWGGGTVSLKINLPGEVPIDNTVILFIVGLAMCIASNLA